MEPISFILGLVAGAGIDELARVLNPRIKGWLERRKKKTKRSAKPKAAKAPA